MTEERSSKHGEVFHEKGGNWENKRYNSITNYLLCCLFGHWLQLTHCHLGWRKTGGNELGIHRYESSASTQQDVRTRTVERASKGIVTVPSPSVLFSKSCLACSLVMRLLPSRNSRNFCGELGVITRWPWVPAWAPAFMTAIYDRETSGKGQTESFKSLYQTMSIFRLKQDSSRFDMRNIWKSYLSTADQRFQKGSVHEIQSPLVSKCTD